MDFELEYKLKQFREEQPDLFDENNERYAATPIGRETGEMMLQLINEFESALAKAETEIKQLTIPVVSQQSELLKAFLSELEEVKSDGATITDEDAFIAQFIKAFNCG